METSYLLVGGDRRQFWLSRLLLSRGRVFTRAVPGLEDSLPERPADVLILPTPCLDRAGRLRTAGEGLELSALAGLYDAHTRICGGALPPDLAARLPGCGRVTDLLADPAVAAVNGRLTAEAAVQLTAERLEGSLFGLSCLVLGYGRIGKPLAALLQDLGARVSVAARRPGVRAEAAQLGYAVRDFSDPPATFDVVLNTVPAQAPAQAFPLGGRCPSAKPPKGMACAFEQSSPALPAGPHWGPGAERACTGADEGVSRQLPTHVIFNTVPAQALSRRFLDALGPDCLWVELASAPGGLPADYRPAFGVLPANSLPGRRLPRSAASALLEAILRREGELAGAELEESRSMPTPAL